MTTKAAAEPTKQNGKDTTAQALKKNVSESVEDTMEAAQETLHQVAEQTSEELRKVADSSTRFVRENPALAVAGALGAGIIIGLAVRGRG